MRSSNYELAHLTMRSSNYELAHLTMRSSNYELAHLTILRYHNGRYSPPANSVWGRLPTVLRRTQQLAAAAAAAEGETANLLRGLAMEWTPDTGAPIGHQVYHHPSTNKKTVIGFITI
jgi:hypothetical protein